MAFKRKLIMLNCLVKLASLLLIQILIVRNEFSYINCYSISPQGKILTPISSQDSVELASRSNQQNLLQLAYLDAHEQQLQQQQHQSQTTLSPLLTTISFNNYLDSIQDQQQQQQQQQHSKQSHTSNNINRHYGNQQLDKDFYVDTNNNNQDYKDNNYSYADLSPSRTVVSKSNQSESVPSSTAINNHSRNSQQVPKLSQYLDVSALMLRDRNLTLENQASHPLSSSPSSSSSSSNHDAGSASITSGSYGLSTPTLNSPSSLTSYLSSGLTAKSHSGLPECATQQVCNAIFVKMNYTQRLCECSSNYNWRCSSEPNEQDGHTIELTRKYDRRIYTQIKTCEPLREIRACKSPSDWTLLALQSERSGKAHYVVVCKCPTYANLEGPYTHNQPPYANIPGIRVYGMLCAQHNARSSAPGYGNNQQLIRSFPEFPWDDAYHVANKTNFSAIHH